MNARFSTEGSSPSDTRFLTKGKVETQPETFLCRMKFLVPLFLLFYIQASFKRSAPVHLKEAGMQFSLPDSVWQPGNRQESGSMIVYSFKRKAITDSLNRGIVANVSVLVENVEKELDVISWSSARRAQVPFQVTKVLTRKKGNLSAFQAIGYEGLYVDSKKISHRILIVYAIHQNKGVQMICDATESIWPIVEPEFRSAIKSLKSDTGKKIKKKN